MFYGNKNRKQKKGTYFANVFVDTMYSMSSVYGFRKANAEVRSQT